MLVFWIASIVLCVFTLWTLWRPLRSNSTLKLESIQQRNIAIARERALEIDSDFEAGDIDSDARDRAKNDLEMALADELASSTELKAQFRTTSKISSFAILIMVPMMAFGLYNFTSNYQADGGQAMSSQAGEVPSLEEIFERLEQRVRDNPSDQQGLYLLAQSYARIGRYEESAQRYRQLIALAPPNADLFASLADSQAMAAGGAFNQDIANTLNKALELDPEHVSALWLSGMANQQLGDPETALKQWLTLKPILAGNAEASSELNILIKDVKVELGDKADAIVSQAPRQPQALEQTASSNSDSTNAGSTGLTVRVSLSQEFQNQAKDTDTVFIFAKAQSGPPMPLAAARHPVSALPITVTLNDNMALLPQMKLSSFAEVLVGARITASGQAIAQSGDLESELIATANTAADTIEIIISKRKP